MLENIKNTLSNQLELKLTDFTLLDPHTLPTTGTACVCVYFLQCMYAPSSLEDKNRPMVKVLFSLIYQVFLIKEKLQKYITGKQKS